MTARAPGRALTFAAAGFLFLDGVLLLLAGVWSGRLVLVFWAAVFMLGGLGVIRLWKRYLGALHDLDAARRALRAEAQRLSQAVKAARR